MPRSKSVAINQYMNVTHGKNNTADLHINGYIMDMDWFDEAVTPQKILDSLSEMKDVKVINMHINSGGGSISAGNHIHNSLFHYKEQNKITINGYISYAASMGSGIAMVCDNIFMYDNAAMMLHNPMSEVYGNSDEMRKTADVLDILKQGLIANYKRHFNGTEQEISDMMDAETWFTAQSAVESGFDFKVIEPLQMVACDDGNAIMVNNVRFDKKELVDRFKDLMATQNTKGKEENSMKYDNCLMDSYGISEETFNSFENVADFMQIVNAKVEAEIEVAKENSKTEFIASIQEGVAIVDNFISITDIAKGLEVENITEEEVIAFAVKGKNVDPEMQNKLAEFEKIEAENKAMKSDVLENALKSGNRAMGAENFDETVWKRTLATMNYADIKVVTSNWDKRAQADLNAGNRASEPQQSFQNKNDGRKFNPKKDKI